MKTNEAEERCQSEKFGAVQDDSDDELEEETLLETPLDNVEPYGLFKATLLSMHMKADSDIAGDFGLNNLVELQREQPQLYQNLTKILNPDELHIIQAVIDQ